MRKNSKTTVKAAKETAAKTTAAAKETVEKIAKEHCVPVTLLCDTNHDLIFDIGLQRNSRGW